MSIHRKLMTGCCIAVLAFGLAACGGGGSQMSSMDETPMQTPAEQLTAAESAVAAAQALVDTASTSAEIAAAHTALAAAQALLTAAQSIPDNQIAILSDQLDQLRMSLESSQMLASQRDSVGQALIAAQNAVNALSATSSDAEADAAVALVMAAQTALAGATALPADDALHTSVAAVATALDGRPDGADDPHAAGHRRHGVVGGAVGGRRPVERFDRRRSGGGESRGHGGGDGAC